jgi:hypothetical protein
MKIEIIYIISCNTSLHIFHKCLNVISKCEPTLKNYGTIQQMTNFITTPSGEMNENFKFPTKHEIL